MVSVAVLVLVWLGLQSSRRTEQVDEERLELLREQRERPEFVREEQRMLEEELEWRRSTMNGEGRPLDSEGASSSNGHSETGQP